MSRLSGCRIHEHALVHGDQVVARRGEVSAAFLVFDDGWRLRLDTNGKTKTEVEVEVESEHEAESILAALGVEARQVSTTVRTLSPFVWPWASVALVVVSLLIASGAHQLGWLPSGVGVLLAAGAVGFVAGLILSQSPSELLVGDDGVITTLLGVRRSHGYSDIVRVTLFEDELYENRGSATVVAPPRTRIAGIELQLRTHKRVRVRLRHAETTARMVRSMVQSALESYRGAGAGELSPVLARGDRSIADWVRALRRLGATGHHRQAAVGADQLLRVATDPSAPALSRASAAIAAAASLSPEDRARLRQSAAATVSPRLRVVLEHASRVEASSQEADGIEDALAELEAEADRRAADVAVREDH